MASALTELWGEARAGRTVRRDRLGWWPMPLLAVVVDCEAQASTVVDAEPLLLTVLPVCVGFLLVSALQVCGLTRWLQLPTDVGRTLAFSLATRNSLVVLPFAQALSVGWETAVVVTVFQSLVELLGMVFYLWWLPRYLFRPEMTDPGAGA